LKTKPTQHSVRELRGIGIQPHVIIPRTDHPVTKEVVSKIALFCDVEEEAVIPLVTNDLLYEVPLVLEDAGLGEYLIKHFQLETPAPDLQKWRSMIKRMRSNTERLRIAIVGKYVELHDAYMSVKEALMHAANANNSDVDVVWVNSGDLEKGRGMDLLESASGIIVPGGFGYRGVEGKIIAAQYARENKRPYLGLCLGMQAMCIEFARNVVGLEEANSAEFDLNTLDPVIDLMLEQRGITDMGGTMRLGLYDCALEPGSKAQKAYQATSIQERHRHRFEFNNVYRDVFSSCGMRFSGINPPSNLVEISEIVDHPFMVGSQFHPEFASRPNRPHPLFLSFIEAALQQNKTKSAEQAQN